MTAVSNGGSTPGPVWSFTTTTGGGGGTATDGVIYAADVTIVSGTWSKAGDPTAAAGVKLTNPDNGVGVLDAPLANPTNYFQTTFDAQAGARYRVWFRVHAINDSKFNDSAFVQFSDSVDNGGSPIYRIGTPGGYILNLWTCSTCQSFGWGWQRNAYWLSDSGDVWFQNSGSHTIRVQIREDGVEIDQIVISPTTFLENAPGPVSNDTTIVPKPNPLQPPAAPGSPNPANGATSVSTAAMLTWSASGATSYDVNFGATNPPPQVLSSTANPSYAPTNLSAGTTYFWQIVARNSGGPTTGSVWSFTTSALPPATPSAPSPSNGATDISTSATLTWSAAGATSDDVLFGTSDPPSQVASGLTAASYAPSGMMPGTTYFWQIVAHNAGGANQGPEWTFTTSAGPLPPAAPSSPSPASGAAGVSTSPTLTWSAAGATSYDVGFGTTNPPPQIASNQASASYAPPTLANGTTYFWQIVAHNAAGATQGPVWTFTTFAPQPPAVPGSPSPASGTAGVSTSPVLTWSAAGATSYEVKFGTADPPPQVVSGQASASYGPPTLANSTTYFCQIVARNSAGATPGPVWSFATAAPPPVNIVIYASDIPSNALHGSWTSASDPTSPNGTKLVTSDVGVANTNNALASPTDYVDVTFDANAGTPYTIWLRLQALNNSKFNDALWVQFSDAVANGSFVYPLNTTSGLLVNLATDSAAGSLNRWGWQNGAYWLNQPTTIAFASGGTHTLRLQVREDGVQLDQIVLSPGTYLTSPPGPVTNDSTIVPK